MQNHFNKNHDNKNDGKGEQVIHNTISVVNTYILGFLMGWVAIDTREKEAERVDKPPVDFFKRNMTTHFLLTKV